MEKDKIDSSNVEKEFHSHTKNIDYKGKYIESASHSIDLIRRAFGSSYPRERTIIFLNCEFATELYITLDSDTKIVFSECTFLGKLHIHCKNLASCNVIGNNLFTCDLQIISDSNGRLILSEFLCLKNLSIGYGLKKEALSLKDVTVRETVEIQGNRDVYLENCRCSELVINWSYSEGAESFSKIDNSRIETLLIGGSQNTKMSITRSRIGAVNIATNQNKEISIDVVETWIRKTMIDPERVKVFKALKARFETLEFANKNQISQIEIASCQIKNLIFNSFLNLNSVRFSNVIFNAGCSLKVYLSDLSKIDFIKCSFTKGDLIFQDSKVNQVFLAETDFPPVVKSENGKTNWVQSQLAFGQISNAYSNQGDSVRSIEYHAREIESHYKSLKWKKAFGIKLNLFLNKISNDFGRNWLAGLLFSLSAGSIFFILFLLTIDREVISLDIWNIIPILFIKFMNPIRFIQIEDMLQNYDTYPTTATYIVDFFGRVFISYGYYQTIQAFRRFGRMSG